MDAGWFLEVDAIFDGVDVRREPVVIAIEDGCIRSIGSRNDLGVAASEEMRTVRGTALPGLIDTHVHLQLSGADDRQAVRDRFEADRAADRLDDVALRNAGAALASGVTTVRDCGSTSSLFALRDASAADGRPGRRAVPRIVATGPPITTRRGQLWWMGRPAADEREVEQAVSELLEAGADAVKIMATGGLLTAESDPYRLQFPPYALAAAADFAHRAGVALVSHALSAAGTVASADAGADSIDHAGWAAEDGGDGWTDAAAARVAASEATIGLTGSGRMRRLLDEPDGALEIRRRADHHRRLAALGARVGVHTDAGASQTGFDGFADTLRVAAVGLGREPREVLRMATSAAASELGLDGEIGRLRPDYRADIVVVDGDPLADLLALHRVNLVVRDGVAVSGKAMTEGA